MYSLGTKGFNPVAVKFGCILGNSYASLLSEWDPGILFLEYVDDLSIGGFANVGLLIRVRFSFFTTIFSYFFFLIFG